MRNPMIMLAILLLMTGCHKDKTDPIPAWTAQTVQPIDTTDCLLSVYFTGNTGYAVGQNGRIIKTINGGNTWTTLTSGTGNDLYSVYFIGNTGYAAGSNGIILKTTDGGTTWKNKTIGVINALFSIYFSDLNTGYAVGMKMNGNGIILKTTDGGTVWAEQTNVPDLTYHWLYSVYFIGNTGYAAGEDGTILKTIDGGTTWTAQESNTTDDRFLSVYFTDVNTGYVVGGLGTILKTTNGGTTWTAQSSGTTHFLSSVFFIGNTGYAVGGYAEFINSVYTDTCGTILKTTNGGSTWTTQTSGTKNILNSVYFIDANTGYAVGNYGTILKATGGGK